MIVYASLISAMPRAGGDYVWQSRILGRALGFVLSVTGWWFILWLWVPLYGQMLVYEFFTPILGILGARDAALWFTGTSNGLLVGSVVVCVLVSLYIALGMKVVCPDPEDLLLGRRGGSSLSVRLAPGREQPDLRQ